MKEHPSFIQRPDPSLCELEPMEPIIVYRIRGGELKDCLKGSAKSVVYFWSPNCSAPVCIPPNFAQEFSSRHGVDLFIVANYYDYSEMAVDFDLERPIFGVDTEYYRTNFTDRYLRRFKADLFDENSRDENDVGRFICLNLTV
ncbi:MAG: hypothetical protein EA411_04085 [Saprospirales bacterium]|nr:MAG: hypothetical protein EA411_04085 [Saprospirales bacterium]